MATLKINVGFAAAVNAMSLRAMNSDKNTNKHSNKVFQGVLCLLVMMLGLVGKNTLAQSERVPMPAGMKAVWVGDNLRHNGHAVQIQSFTYDNSVDSLLSFYRQQWQSESGFDAAPGYVENTVGDWHIISQLKDGKNTVVQIRTNPEGMAEGHISVADIHDVQESSHVNRFPKMSGTELISSTESQDLNKNATTLILQNGFSVDDNLRFYGSRLPNLGWTLQKKMQQEGVGILLFHGKKAQLDMAISKNDSGKTVIIANIVKV